MFCYPVFSVLFCLRGNNNPQFWCEVVALRSNKLIKIKTSYGY
jgi:hypothetical protein